MASVSKRQGTNGTSYIVRYRVEGRSVDRAFRTRRAADAHRIEVEGKTQKGTLRDPRTGQVTLSAYADTWIDTRLTKGGAPLTPSTKAGYRGLLRRNIDPTIGRHHLSDLRPDTIRTWYSQLTATGGADTAAKTYRLLRAILNTALADELIDATPCRIRGAGVEAETERFMPPTPMVLELADALGDDLRAFVLLAGFAALRTGESLGLVRSDIDLLHGTVTVDRQAVEVGGRTITPPKTAAGRRVVNVPRIVVDALDHHLAEWTGPEPGDVLFTLPGGEPMRRATLSARWAEARRAVGAPDTLHPHDLRHHGATLAAQARITTKELMARIGHSSPRAALRYQHATAERDKLAAAYMDSVVANATVEPRADVVPLRSHAAAVEPWAARRGLDGIAPQAPPDHAV